MRDRKAETLHYNKILFSSVVETFTPNPLLPNNLAFPISQTTQTTAPAQWGSGGRGWRRDFRILANNRLKYLK